MHAHAGATHRLASFGTRRPYQLSLEGGVDDIRHPMAPLQSAERDGNARFAEHADGRSVDETHRVGESRRRFDYCFAAARTKADLERLGKAMSALRIAVVDEKCSDAKVEERERNRASGAPGSDKEHCLSGCGAAAKSLLEGTPESDPIGVVAYGPTACIDGDGIDGSNLARLGRYVIE